MPATQLPLFSSPTPAKEVVTPSLGTNPPAGAMLPLTIPELPRVANPDPEPRPAEQSWGTFHTTLSLMADHGKYASVRHYWAQTVEAFEYTRRKIASGKLKLNPNGRTPLLLDARRLCGHKPMAPTFEGCLWAQQNGLWQSFANMEQA